MFGISLTGLTFAKNHYFIKNMFNISLHLATYTLISFKLGMMIDMANLYILVSVWLTLTFAKSRYFIKNMFSIGLHLATYELISFKLGMMIEMANLYILILVWVTLIFSEGHRVMKKLENVHSFCCKMA